MSKTLIVMRHAKSSWDRPQADIERPLNERGREAARKLGTWLRRLPFAVDEVLCSAAVRTQETGALLQVTAPISSIQPLYLASAETLLDYVRAAQGETVLLIGHNPGIADFAERLTITAPNNTQFYSYPTGATSVLSCSIQDWSDLEFASATISDFITPRELHD